MFYQPYCITCIDEKHKYYNKTNETPLQWNIDFSTEDYGYKIDSIVSIYTSSNENCNTHYKIITLYPSDN